MSKTHFEYIPEEDFDEEEFLGDEIDFEDDEEDIEDDDIFWGGPEEDEEEEEDEDDEEFDFV